MEQFRNGKWSHFRNDNRFWSVTNVSVQKRKSENKCFDKAKKIPYILKSKNLIFKTFFESEFKYFCLRKTNKTSYKLHERIPRLVYDYFNSILYNHTFLIHHQNIHYLLVEIFKVVHKRLTYREILDLIWI